jgi:hypothetical protein
MQGSITPLGYSRESLSRRLGSLGTERYLRPLERDLDGAVATPLLPSHNGYAPDPYQARVYPGVEPSSRARLSLARSGRFP